MDIWKIFADYFRYARLPDSAIVHHLPDLPVWEEKILNAIFEKRMATFQHMKYLNDFKLLQLSWIFDLNFPEAFRQANKRGDLLEIANSLPNHQMVGQAIACVFDQLDVMQKEDAAVNHSSNPSLCMS